MFLSSDRRGKGRHEGMRFFPDEPGVADTGLERHERMRFFPDGLEVARDLKLKVQEKE